MDIIFWPIIYHWIFKLFSNFLVIITVILFFSSRFYLFTFIEGKEGRQRGRETSMCGCLSRASHWGGGPQPRHVPWLGIELATLWFVGRCSIHWATSVRTILSNTWYALNEMIMSFNFILWLWWVIVISF